MPSRLKVGDFVSPQPSDCLCVKCHNVPFKPLRSLCCKKLYCEPCSTRSKHCRVHKEDLAYKLDKELHGKIQKLKIHCPYQKNGCQWTGEVSKLKNHLPNCSGSYITSDCYSPSCVYHCPHCLPVCAGYTDQESKGGNEHYVY